MGSLAGVSTVSPKAEFEDVPGRPRGVVCQRQEGLRRREQGIFSQNLGKSAGSEAGERIFCEKEKKWDKNI